MADSSSYVQMYGLLAAPQQTETPWGLFLFAVVFLTILVTLFCWLFFSFRLLEWQLRWQTISPRQAADQLVLMLRKKKGNEHNIQQINRLRFARQKPTNQSVIDLIRIIRRG